MLSFKIIKMTDMSPMHIGLGRDSYDVSAGALHSDTLTAALASVRALSGKDGDLKLFLESFALSSAFPYCGDVLFFPKPNGKLNVAVDGLEEKDYRKLLKKVIYVASSIWKKLITGEKLIIKRCQIHGQYLIDESKDNFLPPMVSKITQRVKVPREDGKNADPFAFKWTYFRKDCGLYCLIDASIEVATEVEKLFYELGQQGVGSDRNVGGGHFGIDTTKTFEMPEVPDADGTMLLSMYIPEQHELTKLNVETSRYQLLKRGGYIAGSSSDNLRHLRKNTVHMFTAGSVFNCIEKLNGKVVDLRPQWKDGDLHPVYRSGKAFSINFKTDWL